MNLRRELPALGTYNLTSLPGLKGIACAGLLAWLVVAAGAAAHPLPVRIVAAESSYGVIAKCIGGSTVSVFSVIDSPGTDPHIYVASAKVARVVLRAQLTIRNGLGFDSWMHKILATERHGSARHIVASKIAKQYIFPNRNPHIFFDPEVARAVARAIYLDLTAMEPKYGPEFRRRFAKFSAKLSRISQRIEVLKSAYPHAQVAALVPIYGYMLRRLGYSVSLPKFQHAVMNGTEPDAQVVAAMETLLRSGKVRLLIYNPAILTPLVKRMLQVARKAAVPTVPVEPVPSRGEGYIKWQLGLLDRLGHALAANGSKEK